MPQICLSGMPITEDKLRGRRAALPTNSAARFPLHQLCRASGAGGFHPDRRSAERSPKRAMRAARLGANSSSRTSAILAQQRTTQHAGEGSASVVLPPMRPRTCSCPSLPTGMALNSALFRFTWRPLEIIQWPWLPQVTLSLWAANRRFRPRAGVGSWRGDRRGAGAPARLR
jgi:hypothetical protein